MHTRTLALLMLLGMTVGLALAFTLMRPLPSAAAPPANTSRDEAYTRVGAPVWGHNQAIATTTGFVYNHIGTGLDGGSLVQDSGAADPRNWHVFEWGTIVVIQCDAVAIFCWAMDDDVTIASGTSGGLMSDPGTPPNAGSDNQTSAPCFQALAGIPRQVVALDTMWGQNKAVSATSPAGYRNNSCFSSGNSGAPCDNDSDCITSAGTTPDAGACGADGGSRPRGMLLATIAPVATNCFITEER